MIDFLENFIDNIAETPKQHYKDLNQATLDYYWNDTTQIRTIKEQVFPFDDKYVKQEVWLDNVSEVTVSTLKVMGNYLEVLFKDVDHPLNHRGQKYLYSEDGKTENVYLCYDQNDELSQLSRTKIIKCNNKIKWRDKKTGNIYEEPLFIGWEISSTNNQVTKKGTVPNRRLVCLIQGNEHTKDIVENQRFMLTNGKCFKVTQLDNMNLENLDDEYATLFTLYIEWSSLLPTDNLEERICDYFDNTYKIKINQTNFEQIIGDTGSLSATVTYNDEVVDLPIKWHTSDCKIISIDNNGNYQVKGKVGSKAKIKATLGKNSLVKDEIEIIIVENYDNDKTIIVDPMISELEELDSIEFKCGVYIENQKQEDLVECNASGIDNKYYDLQSTENGYILTNLRMSKSPLTLTFSSGDCQPVQFDIKLKSLL